jgi:3-deoxy-D-manno-octulosonic-acid transferase
MWKIIYNLGVLAALPAFTILSLLKPKLRRNFIERLLPSPSSSTVVPSIWIHAASLGESVIARSLVARLSQVTKLSFVITTNTHYTRDLLRSQLGHTVEIVSAPFDLPLSIHRFMKGRSFAALVLVETEIWPNLIWNAKAKNIPVIIVNGRISDSTVGRYRRLSFFLSHVLESVDLILAQSIEHAGRFVSLGVDPEKIVTTGNLKYYRDLSDLPPSSRDRRAITFGSVKERELPVILPVLSRLMDRFPSFRFYVAPRELSLADEIERQFRGVGAVRYSAIKAGKDAGNTKVIIVDTIGDLLLIFSESLTAFVGGSLASYGGQNMLEPIFVGTPPIFGPYVENFKSVAEEILTEGAGILVPDGDGLYSAIVGLLDDDKRRDEIVLAGRKIVNAHGEAMRRTTDLIMELAWKNLPN